MKLSFKTLLALWVCKILRAVSRLLRRGGTAMPGRVAARIDPDLLSFLSRDVRTVAVTGTNGKTTCSRMIEEAFREEDLSYFSNRSGANLMSGIITEFAVNSTLFGKMKKSFAIIECDEAAARHVFGKLQPEVIVVTNLFRDQLDRYGEITHTLSNIQAGIADVPNAVLCLNADCSLTASLASAGLSNRVIWFGINASAALRSSPSPLSDASHCIHCKTEYQYEYRTYAHLGGFYCPGCGYRRPVPDYAVTEILCMDDSHSEALISTPSGVHRLNINLPANYNLYNAIASVSATETMGISPETCRRAMSSFSCGFGRMEHFNLAGGTRVVLVKNPTGCSQALEFLSGIQADSLLVMCLNDRDADGTDISWIWDANVEQVVNILDHLPRIYVSGDRADDMRLRLKYAGVPDDRLITEYRLEWLVDSLADEALPVYILPTYTAMLELRSILVHRCGGAEFWE